MSSFKNFFLQFAHVYGAKEVHYSDDNAIGSIHAKVKRFFWPLFGNLTLRQGQSCTERNIKELYPYLMTLSCSFFVLEKHFQGASFAVLWQ